MGHVLTAGGTDGDGGEHVGAGLLQPGVHGEPLGGVQVPSDDDAGGGDRVDQRAGECRDPSHGHAPALPPSFTHSLYG